MASRFVFEVGEKKGVVDLTAADGPGVVEEIDLQALRVGGRYDW